MEKFVKIGIVPIKRGGTDMVSALEQKNLFLNKIKEILPETVDACDLEGVLPEGYDFEAHRELVPMQPGDVPVTYADTSALERDFGLKPSTPLEEGLRRFAKWYKGYYKL